MGEELLWAVKNGDVDAAKNHLERVSPHTHVEGGRREGGNTQKGWGREEELSVVLLLCCSVAASNHPHTVCPHQTGR